MEEMLECVYWNLKGVLSKPYKGEGYHYRY